MKKKGTKLVCPKCRGWIILYVSYKESWCSRCKTDLVKEDDLQSILDSYQDSYQYRRFIVNQ